MSVSCVLPFLCWWWKRCHQQPPVWWCTLPLCNCIPPTRLQSLSASPREGSWRMGLTWGMNCILLAWQDRSSSWWSGNIVAQQPTIYNQLQLNRKYYFYFFKYRIKIVFSGIVWRSRTLKLCFPTPWFNFDSQAMNQGVKFFMFSLIVHTKYENS